MIVVINKPVGAYYAAEVAGPVFREVADKVYASDFDMNQYAPVRFVGNTKMPKVKTGDHKAISTVYHKLGIKPMYASIKPDETGVDTSEGLAYNEVTYKTGVVPNVTGMDITDALYALGNAGYKVAASGSGVVVRQSISGGTALRKGNKIIIELQ